MPFDYHGQPIAILKGRVVAAVLFAVYTIAGWISPTALLGAMAAIGVVLPWLLAKSFRFRARNTSYRGLRFAFTGSVSRAYWVFMGLAVLSAMSFFTLAPYWHRQMKDYLHDNAWYGQQRFTHHTPVSYFYATYAMVILAGGLLLMGGLVLMAILGIVLAMAGPGTGAPPGPSNPPTLFLVAIGLFYVLLVLTVQTLMTVRIQNGVWAHTRIGETRFNYRLAFPRLLAIRVTNLIGLIVTLGLFRPVAQVRLTRYLAESFTVVPRQSLDDFQAVPESEVAAFGEEVAETFDFDIAF